MKILGIDPGVATVGFGLVESSGMHQRMISCGVITTPAHTPLSSRLDRIYSDLEELIRSCDPDAISIEELFFSKNITTGIPVAHARGVILLCAFRCGVPVYEYTPMLKVLRGSTPPITMPLNRSLFSKGGSRKATPPCLVRARTAGSSWT